MEALPQRVEALPERVEALPERAGALPQQAGARSQRAGALPQRVAAVRSLAQGSGYLLSPRLVLTAAHLLGGETGRFHETHAAVPGGAGWISCAVLWAADHLDAALILADDDLVDPATAARFEPVRWGRIDGLTPVAGCHVTGFPEVERAADGRLDSSQVVGTLAPGTGLLSHRQVVVIQQAAPRSRQGSSSPWSGMSGAGVLCRDRLLGLAVRDRDPKVWRSSQLELVPAFRLLANQAFVAVLEEHLGSRPVIEAVLDELEAADADFEREYAEAIRADYGRIRIFGLKQAHSQGRRGWDLDAAYLSLQALPANGARRSGGPESAPQRVEQLLRGRQRVLLRGQAGSGKTTLVQWLAVQAIAGTLGEDLAELNHRVPFVLQLRKLFRKGTVQPRPEEFLQLDDRMCADRQPPNWAHRMLRDGRALLLVDGLDEVPAAQRNEALDWLDQLLSHYPGLWTLATVRPSAVPPGWLEHLGFEEMSLCPMVAEDRRLFIDRWHRAALQEMLAGSHTTAEAARWQREVAQDQADLLLTLETSAELAQLTDSPLLCAMICALNRESDGMLPRRRMDLYRDALSMLLVKRDESRRVPDAEQLKLSEEEQLAMLRRVAYWLVKNNQVEGGRADAVAQIAKALLDLPNVARQGSAEQAYAHLLNRSGLVAETSLDTFQFVHRTFQDYLAAMEFREERDFGMLARNATDEQWGDVIRMTVGHCGRRERAELLMRILAAGDRSPVERQVEIYLTAGSCLPNAPEMDADVRKAVLDGLRRHLQRIFASRSLAARLSEVGEAVVPLLREAARDLLSDRARTWELPEVLGRIGGEQALSALAELLAEDASYLKLHFRALWSQFDARAFAEQVLARVDLSALRVEVGSLPQAAELSRHSRFAATVEELTCWNVDGLSDISFLRDWTQLSSLGLFFCPDLEDLTPLRGMTLASLNVRAPGERSFPGLLAVLREVHGLTRLMLDAPDLASAAPGHVLPGVVDLALCDVADGYPFGRVLEVFPALERLELVPARACSEADLSPLAAHPHPEVRVDLAGRGKSVRFLGEEAFLPGRLVIDTRPIY